MKPTFLTIPSQASVERSLDEIVGTSRDIYLDTNLFFSYFSLNGKTLLSPLDLCNILSASNVFGKRRREVIDEVMSNAHDYISRVVDFFLNYESAFLVEPVADEVRHFRKAF